MTTGKTIALTRWTFVGKVMCLLFNMLSRLVITFLPRSKRLLISRLQSPSALILEPPKIKSDTVSTVSPSLSHEVMGLDAMIIAFWMLSLLWFLSRDECKWYLKVPACHDHKVLWNYLRFTRVTESQNWPIAALIAQLDAQFQLEVNKSQRFFSSLLPPEFCLDSPPWHSMASNCPTHRHSILQPSPIKPWGLVSLSLKPSWLLTCSPTFFLSLFIKKDFFKIYGSAGSSLLLTGFL